jgi:hypothetical protein
MSRSLAQRAAALALEAAQQLVDDLEQRRESYQAEVDEWNAWLATDGHDGSEDDAPAEPPDHPPLPDRQLLYALQVASGASRNRDAGRPRRKKGTARTPSASPQRRSPKQT